MHKNTKKLMMIRVMGDAQQAIPSHELEHEYWFTEIKAKFHVNIHTKRGRRNCRP
ncbi:hypothetical protein PAJ34TS1_37530 [Paenibacillus azoreducens]